MLGGRSLPRDSSVSDDEEEEDDDEDEEQAHQRCGFVDTGTVWYIHSYTLHKQHL
jgi:hypothetical protein